MFWTGLGIGVFIGLCIAALLFGVVLWACFGEDRRSEMLRGHRVARWRRK